MLKFGDIWRWLIFNKKLWLPPSVKKFVGAGGAEIIKQFRRNWKVDM